MADPNQTPKREYTPCPCNGCTKARKFALQQVQNLLMDKDIVWGWHKASRFISEELGKK